MAVKNLRTELDSIRDILARCDAQIESYEEEIEELHLIEKHRKRIAEASPSSHTKGRHLVAIERIEVSVASVAALNKTKATYKERLREIIGDVKKVIRASHADVAEATSAETHDSAALPFEG